MSEPASQTSPTPRPRLFELPSPFLEHEGLVRLLEPLDSDGEALSARLLEGTYGKPFLLERDRLRHLHFSIRFVQSAMRIDAPEALTLAYTRKVMAFLLFHPRPRRILLLGLGGGSLAKYCYRHLPDTEVVALEIDPHVLALREEFHVPPDNHRFAVIEGDGAQYVAEHPGETDVLVVDTFDEHGVAPSLAAGDFFARAFQCLSEDGVLVMNVAGDRATYLPHVEHLRRTFGGRVIAISVRDDANFVLFAFKAPSFAPCWPTLHATALELRRRFDLDFRQFAKQLERGHRLRLVRRITA